MSDNLNKELSETVQDRLQALQELTEFTENCEAKLKALFESLGWDQEWSENISKVTRDLFCFRPQSIFLVFLTLQYTHFSSKRSQFALKLDTPLANLELT